MTETDPGQADPRGLRSAPKERVTKPRRRRSTTETLLSMVLILEGVLVFFVTLTVFGLKALDPVTAFVGGGVMIVVFFLASALLRYPWGIWLGWALQVALLATGFLLPIMFAVAAGFVAFWVYCFLKAREIDRKRAEYEAALLATEPADADAASESPASNHSPSPNQGESP